MAMFVVAVVLGVGVPICELLITQGAASGPDRMTSSGLLGGALFLVALFRPRVCPKCHSPNVIPESTPAAKLHKLRIIELAERLEAEKAADAGKAA